MLGKIYRDISIVRRQGRSLSEPVFDIHLRSAHGFLMPKLSMYLVKILRRSADSNAMATDLRNMMSDVIGETARRNDYEGNKGFVPQCKLDEIITEEVVMDVSPEINQPSNLVKVTAILLYITDSDARASLSGLYGSGLTDGHLPVVYDESAKQLASGEGKNRRVFNTSLEAFQCRRFVESQWHFHVPTLGDDKKEENGNLVLDARSILPILHCGDKRYSGAYGEVHQVKLHHGYLKITPAPVRVPPSPTLVA